MGGMFVKVVVVLARVKLAIFLLDKEERGCLRGVGRTNFPRCQVFFEEVLSSFLFIWGKQVDFAYLRHKVFVKVDLMVI